ncbi:MAG: type II secretion system F family protein [Planctomycetaceae bacterium]|jgi:general secretion pathway protein F/type IV pilus assembly protein PilC|nr:type II secretion system F family protein [Planctomycetaceae bacterium]
MPSYRYVARNQLGAKIEGHTDAATEAEAVAALTAAALFPLEIKPIGQQAVTGKVRRVNGQLLAGFYSQLADLLKSGVPLLRALKVLHDQSSNNNLKFVLDNIYRRVEAGETLAEAMGRYPVVFGEMGIQMVRAGGEGGFLEESLNHIADYTEAQDDLKGKIVGALVYPVLLLCIMVIAVTVLMLAVVPKFAPMFAAMRKRGELPMATEVLLLISDNMPYILMVAVPALIVGVIWYRVWSRTPTGSRSVDQFKLRIPVAGKVYEGFAVARFCRILGTLLRNGVPIMKSLEISGAAVGNKILSDAISKASENIGGGSRLADPLAKSGCFPRMVVEMISVAEESNTLDTVLVEISESLERRNWRALDLAVRFAEPLMLVMLGMVVLALVVSIMLPLFSMDLT